MKKLVVLALSLFLFPVAAHADGFMDVIQADLVNGCTAAEYAEIAADFNEQWGKDHGYKAEILVALQSQDLASVFWIGRTANAAAFGAAWDAWRDALPNANSTAAKLQARFDQCVANTSRRSYDVL